MFVNNGTDPAPVIGMTDNRDTEVPGTRYRQHRHGNPEFLMSSLRCLIKEKVVNILAEFIDKFRLNFIEDKRYEFIFNGLKTTLIITAFAVLIGIVLGFIIAMIRSTHDRTGKMKILNAICKVYLTVIRGTPAMVQLLIMYYVVFAVHDPGKMITAIIAFGLNSAAYVAEIVRSGIMSIDQGQFEAGRSLGFNYRQTMLLIILPQAFKNVLPALANEFIVLMKETSISGYIGITDLTRGGDIIRSQTYEALLPLLAVAAIYLILVMFLSYLVGKLERRLRSSER